MNEQIVFPDSNRIGKFRILYEILRDGRERPLLQALFGLCVILQTEPCESGRGTFYIAASDLFQPLAEGEEIPEYRLEVAWPDQAFPDPEREKDALQSNGFRFAAIRKVIVRVPLASFSVQPQATKH